MQYYLFSRYLRGFNFCGILFTMTQSYSIIDGSLYTRPSHDRKIDSQRRLRIEITNSGGGCAHERVRRAPRKEIFQCSDIEVCTYLENRSR